MKYYYDKADFAGMKQELSSIDWEEKLSTQDVNKQLTVFKDTVLCIQDKYIPKHKSRAATDRKGKTNIDLNTLKVIRKKHRCWSRFLETWDGERYKEYCKLCNQVKSLTRKAVKNKENEIAKGRTI